MKYIHGEKRAQTHPLFPHLLFRFGRPHFQPLVFPLLGCLHRFAQYRSADAQFRHVLFVKGVIRLKVIDLRGVCSGVRSRYLILIQRVLNLRGKTHLHRNIRSKWGGAKNQEREREICETDRNRVLERAFGIHEIPLDDRIRRLELTKLGIVRLAKQILCDCR
jgi:hypothetical protein